MNVTARLLTTTTRSISTISEQTGYDSETVFHRAFKRAFEMAPAAYRRSLMLKTKRTVDQQKGAAVLPQQAERHYRQMAGTQEATLV